MGKNKLRKKASQQKRVIIWDYFFEIQKTFTDDPREVSKFEQVAPIVKQNRIEGLDIQNEIEIAILKQFTFSSSLLRMSVVCKSLGSQTFEVFTKGAPEKIITLCKPETSS